MSTKIEINDIIDANAHNSAMALTAEWAKTFSLYALENYEELSDDPASSFNVFLHLTAQGAAKMMYEQQARINETNVSTAILPKSLLNKLSNEELTGIFGNPASLTLAFCIKKDDIIKYGVYDSTDDVYQIVINKNLTATFESHPTFTLPYDVIINCKHIIETSYDSSTGEQVSNTSYNIYAYYNMPSSSNDGMRSIFNINNQYISSREMRFEGTTYIAFFVKMFQMERKEVEVYVSDPYTADTSINFDDYLIGVEVFRTPIKTKTEVLMTGYPEGNTLTSNTYNYSYDTKRNTNNFNVIFSKMNDNTALTIGDSLRIVVYTTKGQEGNIEFPYMIYNMNKLLMAYNQDLSNAKQNAVLNFKALAFARDQASTGGTDSLSLEEIRSKIISKMYNRNLLISNREIISKGTELGLNIKRIQQDLTAMYYQSVDKLTYNNMILSTGTNDFYFDFTKKGHMENLNRYYMIEPTDVFKFDKQHRRFNYVKSYNPDDPDNTIESYNTYVSKYNSASEKEDVLEVSFPFHIRYENSENPKIQVYDMHLNDIEYLSFDYYDESVALDKLDIQNVKIIRNPYRGSSNGSFDPSLVNQYVIQFIVYTGENTILKLLDQINNSDNTKNYVNSTVESEYLKQYVTFELGLVGVNDTKELIINPVNVQILNIDTMESDGYIAYQGYFETTNFVTDESQLQINGIRLKNSINHNYNQSQLVDTKVNLLIRGKFNDSINNPSNKECIGYKSDIIELVSVLNDDFNITFDIETKPLTYKTYESNIPYKYDSFARIKNKNYDPTLTDKTLPNYYEYEVLVDDNGKAVMLDSDNPRYKYGHKPGEIIYDYTKVVSDTPNSTSDYYVLYGQDEYYDENSSDSKDHLIYVLADVSAGFDPNVQYYTAKARIKHKLGDYIYYNRVTGEENDDGTEANINCIKKANPEEYTGICKNVPWINRLYMVGENMYNKMVAKYYDIIDRTATIRNLLFDGGKIFIGLSNTSGKSKKFMAYKLANNSKEYLNDLALSLEFKVKYYTNENFTYKNEQIKSATMDYIANIGDNIFSVDKLFETIKNVVPDIEYINIIKINNYKNGEVQTILNDTSISDEVLTVSQKLTTDDTGDIDFEPDITIDVVQVDL
jgi:hypothetical protein